MVPSAFNVRAPLASGDVFLMNTLTDAQFVVSPDVASLLDTMDADAFNALPPASDVRQAAGTLSEHGFLVTDPGTERAALESHFAAFRTEASELRVTVLTTMQCNFACEYCYQGDHGPAAKPAEKMSMETARRVSVWIAAEMQRLRPAMLVITFFGGEPLLNQPALCEIAERCAQAARDLEIEFAMTIITNGLLLTPEVVARLVPLGLRAVKVTLDGDRDTHDRVRPMRGGQPTFDRIVDNMRRVAPLVPLSVGGNFDAATVERYPALLAFLREQEFADRIIQVSFKPIIQPARTGPANGVIPLTAVGSSRSGSGCGSGTGSVGRSACDSCHFVDDQMAFLQTETRRHGFATLDGVHMGPCELYRQHSHTIGPDGTLFACPGFTGDNAQAVGHIERGPDVFQAAAATRVAHLAPWRQCGDCAFIPVCGGGCAVAAHTEGGDMAAPACHKRAFESAVVNLAAESAISPQGA
ncbi:MAG: radical SAM protein [Vicinamibacterales bacterium]|nr:radical SAM protein [Vicinamibacterales bacterium]